jgi:hypothetical protein
MTRLEPYLFYGLLGLMVAMLLAVGPVLTSDGPAHVSIAHFLRHAGDPDWPQLNRLYAVNPALAPNALGHFALAGLMGAVSPLRAELAVQAACLLGIPLAARLLLRRISPEAGWLALFFLPVALQRLFYLGLYNFSLSVAGFLLCLWGWLGVRERPSARRAAGLAGLLLLTLACQAAGWIVALAAMHAMLTVEALLALGAGRPLGRVVRVAVATLLAIVPSVALFLLFSASSAGGAGMEYGALPLERMAGVLRGVPFATIGRISAMVALALTLVLLGLVAAGMVRVLLAGGQDAERGTLPLVLGAVPVALLAFALVVPERAAGGWSHVWRAQAFPYMGLALAAAALPCAAWLRRGATAAAAAGGLVAIGLAFWLQATQVPPVVARFAEADALVGPHCSVVPVLGHYKLDRANSARVIHHPTFHLVHRMQWRGDRPVLFSYNARLSVYPARFRPEADPQRLLYGWAPEQGDTMVRALDIPGWEAASGIRVDFVLLWDVLPDDAPGPHAGIRTGALAGFTLAHRSADGRLELYRRGGSGSGGCAGPG